MEQSKALTRLLEAADLTGMLEDLAQSATTGKLTPASLAGMRITLHNIREAILSSHDTLASSLVSRARAQSEREGDLSTPPARPMPARDLRTSLEKFVDSK
ncbi:MAG: hypothetical protein J0M12_13655 [Deltaproteobacteria bacterium]|nr:hypothetical protein [Deltaproteobacteria bacterium]